MSLLNLPQRTAKPRPHGITMVNDTGTPVNAARDLVADYGDYIDYVKLGVGTAYATPNLERKIAVYQDAGIPVYFGGTLFEKFHYQGKFDEYLRYLRDLGIKHLEISNGTIDLSLEDRAALVREVKDEFGVFAEVGCKDQAVIMPPSQWIEEIKALVEAGVLYIIAEGRDSGTAGLYRNSGEIRTGLVTEIFRACNAEKIIFEAPTYGPQMFLINMMGANVNLGNIRPQDVLILEAERVALRNETFFLGEEKR